MVAKVSSVAPVGFEGSLIEVEADLKQGLPSMQIVGLGNKAIDEAKERVRSAISNSLLEFPAKKLVVNLAPAELPKDGAHYDLSIALSILIASGQLRQEEVNGSVFAGELALDGSLRPIRGSINIAETSRREGFSRLFLPASNAEQASLIGGLDIIGVNNLKEIFLHLKQEIKLPTHQGGNKTVRQTPKGPSPRLDDIHGQSQAKRALTIATAGRHNILLNGPPGAGKTMLARTILGLLPPLTSEEMIAITKLHSLAGEIGSEILSSRPFRSPHHTASRTALIGGGSKPKPGEISLAHLGVLFLDELPEYPRATLEALRQPLEDRQISVARADGRATYPADFMLVATMNPCPCGYYGDSQRECTCTSTQVLAYQKRLSGPLIDRIDLTINVSRVPHKTLLEQKISSKSQQSSVVDSIARAVKTQSKRYNYRAKYNSTLSSSEIARLIPLSQESKQLLSNATERLGLTARGYFKIIRVARTIADIDGDEDVQLKHISEALQFRGGN